MGCNQIFFRWNRIFLQKTVSLHSCNVVHPSSFVFFKWLMLGIIPGDIRDLLLCVCVCVCACVCVVLYVCVCVCVHLICDLVSGGIIFHNQQIFSYYHITKWCIHKHRQTNTYTHILILTFGFDKFVWHFTENYY